MSEEKDYDVVLDVLQKHADKLWEITKRNMTSEYIGMGIMDDIRLEQIDQLKEAMELWKNREKYYDYEFRYEGLNK